MNDDRAPVWMPLKEAALRLGISTEAVRARIRRGQLESRRGNNGRVMVLVSAPTPAEPGTVEDRAMIDRLRSELDDAHADADHWRTVAEQRAVEAAEARARLEARETLIQELRELLAEARRPWWRRWLG